MYICFNTMLTGFNMRITESHLRRIIREELMLELAPPSGRSFDMKGGPSVKGAEDMVAVARSAIKKLENDPDAMQAIEDYFTDNPDVAEEIIKKARSTGNLREADNRSVGDQIADNLPGYGSVVGAGAGIVYGAAQSPYPAITKMIVNVLHDAGVTNKVPALYDHMQQLTYAGLEKMALGAGSGAALGLVLGFLAVVAYDVIQSMKSSTGR